MIFLLPFANMYFYQQGFLALTVVKTKANNRLDSENNLHLALNKIELCIEDIAKKGYFNFIDCNESTNCF